MKTGAFTTISLFAAMPAAVIVPSGFPLFSAQAAAKSLTAREAYLVSSLTYQSSAAQAALKRQHTVQLDQQRKVIDSKDAQLRTLIKENQTAQRATTQAKNRVSTLELEITELKRGFAEQLSALDVEFARERQSYELAANDLLKTSEGERALEVFLSGEHGSAEAAIEILQRVTAKRNAADKRATAKLGNDAQQQGRLTNAFVLKLWADVVAADGGESSDWRILALRYQDAGQIKEAKAATDRAIEIAVDARERLLALNLRTSISGFMANFDAMVANSETALALARGLRDADVFSLSARTDLLDTLSQRGTAIALRDVANGTNSNAELTQIFEESYNLAMGIFHENPRSIESMRDVILHSLPVIEHRIRTNSIDNSMEIAGLAVLFAHSLDQLKPNEIQSKTHLALSLTTLGNLQLATGNRESAIKAYSAALDAAKKLLLIDPESVGAQSGVATVSVKLADMGAPGYSYRDALAVLEKIYANRALSPAETGLIANVRNSALAEERSANTQNSSAGTE
jgi:hypothetical protein